MPESSAEDERALKSAGGFCSLIDVEDLDQRFRGKNMYHLTKDWGELSEDNAKSK